MYIDMNEVKKKKKIAKEVIYIQNDGRGRLGQENVYNSMINLLFY